jgi:hypothetical protein
MQFPMATVNKNALYMKIETCGKIFGKKASSLVPVEKPSTSADVSEEQNSVILFA